jgi:hypothetical protein
MHTLTATDATRDLTSLTLGVLGADAEIAALAAEAARRGARLVEIPESTETTTPAEAAAWQRLLDEASCDAVLVGTTGWSPERAEAVRMLVQAGRTLVVAHPLETSMLWAFELDMIRRDSGATLIPYLPDRPGYNKRLRHSGELFQHVIASLARACPSWNDDLWLVDSTPVECGRSRETAKRSDLAGWATYGYCASHSRFFGACASTSSPHRRGYLSPTHSPARRPTNATPPWT